MPPINIITATFCLIIIALLTALAFKLRDWISDVYRIIADLRSEVSVIKESQSSTNTSISNLTAECVNASSLASLGFRFPVFLGNWSIDSFLGRWLVQHLLEQRPKCIVELGSGSSTVLIARTLQLLGESSVDHIAVDHDEKYLGLTRDVAALNGVADRVEFLHCPLVRYEALDKLWYEALAIKLGGRKIDLLLVDGPPGPLQPISRYPAIPLLLSHLATHCTVVLDDACRGDEQTIARRWAEEHPEFRLNFMQQGHGLAVLTRC